MSYRDLPPDVRHVSLADPVVAADVVDLFVGLEARVRGCLGFMLCDAEDHGVTPVVIDEVGPDADPGSVVPFLEHLTEILQETNGSVLFARGRPGGVLLTDADRAWHQCVIDACQASGVRLLGAYLAIPSAVRPLPLHLARSAS